MENLTSNSNVFTKNDKNKILNTTLDITSKGFITGSLLGGSLSLITKNKYIGLFVFSYAIGNSIKESEDSLSAYFK